MSNQANAAMNVEIIKIAKRFDTIREAADFALACDPEMFAYNPQEAARKIADSDRGHKHGGQVWKAVSAFVTDANEIFYVHKCDIQILHKFEAFHSILDSNAFKVVTIEGDEIKIHNNLTLGRDSASRKVISKAGIIVTT
jgi:hypothetical protein